MILPVHDGMPYLRDSIESVLAQTWGDFEFLIGDNGSRDGSWHVAQHYASADARIRLFRAEQPLGLAGSANWLARQARAALIAVIHADDRAYPQRFARQVAALSNDRSLALVGTLWDGMDEAGRRIRPGDFWRLLQQSRFAPFSHSSIMVRRAAFEAVGGYREAAEYWEDLDLYYRIAATGRIGVIGEVLTTVRHSRISTKLRGAPERFEFAVDQMFGASALFAAGGDPIHLPARKSAGKVHPLAFLSYGSTLLWSGRRPGVFARMIRRARLRPDRATLHALIWLSWASVSPRSLRAFLRLILATRNRVAKPLLPAGDVIEWIPRRTGVRYLA
ncbi:glycosyltransferase family 2 protein [Sphingomonas sp.]|uniref:glycosyltransferase family 2 protein n=1 Tax=Sphingomonas sp. TaxID=28214 RepID=UPI003B3A317F